MPPDRARLVGRPPIRSESRHGPRDTILYALGIGAGELRHIYEDGLAALPTMAVILADPGWPGADDGLTPDVMMLHAQSVMLHRPLPAAGHFVGETMIEDIFASGVDRDAVMVSRRTIAEAGGGGPIATVRSTHILRGHGGPGPRRAPPALHVVPKRAADTAVSLATWPHQAALYRLSGEKDAVHIDPEAAHAVGLDRPPLPPLCIYGIAGRALVRALCGNVAARVRRIDARFRGPVYPGETVRTEIWEEGPGRAAFRAFAAERGQLVLSNGYVEFEGSENALDVTPPPPDSR